MANLDPLPDALSTANGETSEPEGKKKKKKKDREPEYTRAVETLFRSVYHTHVSLTAMADGKASIMITINGLLLTVVLASVAPRLVTERWLTLPTLVVMVTCLVSLLYAVVSVRPRIIRTALTLESVRRDSANLLFFGNYTQLGERDFRQGIAELLHDPDAMYEVMTRDIFGMGSVLSEKYRLLRHSYDVFAGGLVLGVLSYIGAYIDRMT